VRAERIRRRQVYADVAEDLGGDLFGVGRRRTAIRGGTDTDSNGDECGRTLRARRESS
jgi:hypothetical protein